MKLKPILAPIIGAVIILLAQGTVQTAAGDGLREEIVQLLEKHDLPGAGIAVVSRDSVLWLGGVGLADRNSSERVSDSTRFRLGSISKSFTGLGVLKLVSNGTIDLQTPVTDIAPEMEIENPWRDSQPVRLVHLLEHTSGFEDEHFKEGYNLGTNPDPPLRDVMAISPSTRRARWEPGTMVSYSNHGFSLAAYLLEQRAGEPFEDLLQKEILGPLGMTETSFREGAPYRARLAMGHDAGGSPMPFVPLYLRPASTLKSSPRDMAKFLQMLLNDGRTDGTEIIPSDWLERMRTPTSGLTARTGNPDGYGVGSRVRYWRGHRIHGHGGGLPDFTATYGTFEKHDLGYAILLNAASREGLYAVRDAVLNHFGPAQEAAPPPAVAVSPEQLQDYAGYYQYCNSERRLDAMLNIMLAGVTITSDGDSLFQQGFMEGKSPLIPVTGNTFRKSDEAAASLVFFEDEQGRRMLAEPVARAEYVRTGAWRPVVYRILFVAAVAVLLSSLVYALFWVPRYLYQKLRGRHMKRGCAGLRAFPLLAVLSLAAGLFGLSLWSGDIVRAGTMTPGSILFFVGTLLFAAFSILSLLTAFRSYAHPVHPASRVYGTLVALACAGMTAYLGYWGLIGLRLWAY